MLLKGQTYYSFQSYFFIQLEMILIKRYFSLQYFFPQRVSGIHEPLYQKISRAAFKKIRLVSWVFLTIFYIWEFNLVTSIFIELAYLSSIGLFVTWLYFSTICLDQFLKSLRKYAIQSSPHLRYWVQGIFETAIVLETPITIAYWLIILPYDLKYRRPIVLYLMIVLHSLPIICLLADFNFNRYRFHIRRVLFPLLIILIYTIFNIAYSLSVKPLYPLLKWKGLKSYLIIGALILISILAHLLYRYLKTRNHPVYQINMESRQDEPTTEVSEKGSKIK